MVLQFGIERVVSVPIPLPGMSVTLRKNVVQAASPQQQADPWAQPTTVIPDAYDTALQPLRNAPRDRTAVHIRKTGQLIY